MKRGLLKCSKWVPVKGLGNFPLLTNWDKNFVQCLVQRGLHSDFRATSLCRLLPLRCNLIDGTVEVWIIRRLPRGDCDRDRRPTACADWEFANPFPNGVMQFLSGRL